MDGMVNRLYVSLVVVVVVIGCMFVEALRECELFAALPRGVVLEPLDDDVHAMFESLVTVFDDECFESC